MTGRRWARLRVALVPLACLMVAGNALTVPVLFVKLNSATKDNCRRIHGVVHTVDGFLVGSRPRLVQLEREGTLTREQVQRALRDNDAQRKKLRVVDCPTRPPRP